MHLGMQLSRRTRAILLPAIVLCCMLLWSVWPEQFNGVRVWRFYPLSVEDNGTSTHPPLDIIYLYFNGTDIKSRAKVQSAAGRLEECDRAQSNNEILMSLLSVQRFLPWVHSVYIIVDEQKLPLEFLDPGFREKVHVTEVQDIVPAEFLPNFNSHTLETFIHRVQGLVNDYLYLNDDMVFAAHVLPEHIFQQNIPRAIMLEQVPPFPVFGTHLLDMAPEDLKNQGYLHARRNAAILFEQRFGYRMNWTDAHVAYVLTKETQRLTYQLFRKELARSMLNKLRKYGTLDEGGDVHFSILSQFVGIHMEYLIPQARNISPDDKGSTFVTTVLGKEVMDVYEEVLNSQRYHIVCLQSLVHVGDEELDTLCASMAHNWCDGPQCANFKDHCSWRAKCNWEDSVPHENEHNHSKLSGANNFISIGSA